MNKKHKWSSITGKRLEQEEILRGVSAQYSKGDKDERQDVVLVALKKFYKPCFVPLAQLSKMKADGDITHINYCGCRVSINP